jgi:hypothetical protein
VTERTASVATIRAIRDPNDLSSIDLYGRATQHGYSLVAIVAFDVTKFVGCS